MTDDERQAEAGYYTSAPLVTFGIIGAGLVAIAADHPITSTAFLIIVAAALVNRWHTDRHH